MLATPMSSFLPGLGPVKGCTALLVRLRSGVRVADRDGLGRAARSAAEQRAPDRSQRLPDQDAIMKSLKRERHVTAQGKRRVAVKGANGFFDRMDSLCVATPIFFHSARWCLGT